MRRLRDLSVPQDGNNSLFPDGQIRNEALNQQGTPVVREVYGDVLTNAYAILRNAGIDFNGLEDNETNGYQLLKALKQFVNELNDIEQILTVSGTQISININLDLLPNNYVINAKASDNIPKGTNLTLTSNGSNSFTFQANENIASGDTFIFVFAGNDSKFISLSAIRDYDAILTPFDGVLSFNNTEKIFYYRDGFVLTNIPESFDVIGALRDFSNNQDLILLDVIVHRNFMISMCLTNAIGDFEFYFHNVNNPENVINQIGFNQPSLQTYDVYMYANEDNIFLTNYGSASLNDFEINQYSFDGQALNLVGSLTLNETFTTSSNVIAGNDNLLILKNNELKRYGFDGSVETLLNLPNVNGQIFKFDGQIYYKNGNLSIPWNV